MKVVNQCRLTYSYQPDDCVFPLKQTIFSNQTETTILKQPLIIKQTASRPTVAYGDILSYSITIKNITSLSLHHLCLTNLIPSHTTFVQGSFKLNDVSYPCLTNLETIKICTLLPKATQTICFSVRVHLCSCFQAVCTRIKLTYDHYYSDTKNPLRMCVKGPRILTPLSVCYVQDLTYHVDWCVKPGYELYDVSLGDMSITNAQIPTFSGDVMFSFKHNQTKETYTCTKRVHLLCTKQLPDAFGLSLYLWHYQSKRINRNCMHIQIYFVLTKDNPCVN